MTDISTVPARRATFPIWAWVAAAVLALVTGYSVRQMGIQTTQMTDLRKQMKRAELQNQALQVQLELSRQLSAIMVDPDSKLLKLAPRDSKLPIVFVYIHPHMGLGITADQMPGTPSARTLQLWIMPKKGNPISVAIFRPDSKGQVSLVAQIQTPTDEIAAFAISEEPAGGSPQPTSTPEWVAQLK